MQSSEVFNGLIAIAREISDRATVSNGKQTYRMSELSGAGLTGMVARTDRRQKAYMMT